MDWYIYTGDWHGNTTPPPRAGYGDFDRVKDPKGYKDTELYVLPEYLSGGDYDHSGLVQRSNHRTFLKSFKNKDGVHDLSGGMGTYGVAVRKDVLESNEEIRKALDALEGYPIIDEEDYSALRNEEQEEAWKNWAEHDVLRSIQGEFPDWEPEDDDQLSLLFHEASEESNNYWQEDGGSMWIDINKVVPYILDRLTLEQTPEKDLPLLLTREWKSESARKEFEQRLKGVSNGKENHKGMDLSVQLG